MRQLSSFAKFVVTGAVHFNDIHAEQNLIFSILYTLLEL
jgi:hypothetical protein